MEILWNFMILIDIYRFISFTTERNFRCSLAVASRPLTLSRQRRLYLHPAQQGQYFSSAIGLRFYSPSRR